MVRARRIGISLLTAAAAWPAWADGGTRAAAIMIGAAMLLGIVGVLLILNLPPLIGWAIYRRRRSRLPREGTFWLRVVQVLSVLSAVGNGMLGLGFWWISQDGEVREPALVVAVVAAGCVVLQTAWSGERPPPPAAPGATPKNTILRKPARHVPVGAPRSPPT